MAAALAATLVACTDEPEAREGMLDVAPAVSLDDEPVRIQVTGLSAGQQIELTATATGIDGATWSSSATFTANGDGVVDLDRDAPDSGDYQGVDGMGLIAAMAPTSAAAPAVDPSASPPGDAPSPPSFGQLPTEYPITVAVTDGAEVQISRVNVAPGVTVQEFTVAEHGVAGVLATPGEAAGPGVLLVGGSEGGVNYYLVDMALMLAAHGYPTLALGYFNSPGLPGELRNIPIEYFANAATKLPGPVRVVGISRGSEAALLLSALYPELVAGTVLAAPAGRVNLGFPNGGYAWTFGNGPRLDIPFSSIVGPVLAFAGTDDAIWPSADNVTRLAEQLGDRLQSQVIDGAGHDILGVPYVGADPETFHPVTGSPIHMGGTRQVNEQARRETWAALLQFLAPTS
jgi:pimeloyl-ACP methyl ester carboxylesterase